MFLAISHRFRFKNSVTRLFHSLFINTVQNINVQKTGKNTRTRIEITSNTVFIETNKKQQTDVLVACKQGRRGPHFDIMFHDEICRGIDFSSPSVASL